MAESTLSGTRTEILRAFGRTFAMSRTSADWSSDMTQDVNDAILAGERQFYEPPVLPGETVAHQWSFLKRQLQPLHVVSGVAEYDLPDDFGNFLGSHLQFSPDDNAWHEIDLTDIGEIERQRSINPLETGRPCLAATIPLPTDGSLGQRWALVLWPTPDSDYSLTGQYFSYPYAIAASTPYPLGGQPHFQCLMESCLAMGELYLEDLTDGPHAQKFLQLLKGAVAHDRQTSTPKYFGYNGDPSSHGAMHGPLRRHLSDNTVTYASS